MSSPAAVLLAPTDSFARRHTGDSATETAAMLALLGYSSVDALVDAAVPPHIRRAALNVPAALGETAALAELRGLASENKVFRNFIGTG
jgi:glycine dehydrogenase